MCNTFYFDESIHDRGNFIIGCFIYSRKNLSTLISEALTKYGYNPRLEEFKSSVNYSKEPGMIKVRDELKNLISNTKIGLVIIPRNQRDNLGFEGIKALKQFIDTNIIEEKLEIFFDQGIFSNQENARKLIKELCLDKHEFHFEQDSKEVKGIQLADLCAHSMSIMLLEALGVISKKVKVGENCGYDSDLEIEIGYEMWATLRYYFFHENTNHLPDPVGNYTFKVEPYGLYISDYCDAKLAEVARSRFEEVYIGCIH